MARLHGRKTKVFFNEFDLSGVLNSAGMSVVRDTADVTTFASGGWKEYISGLLSANFPFEGNYDMDQQAPVDTFGADSGVLTYCPGAGAAIGDLARLAPVTGTTYDETSPIGDKVAFSWDAIAEEAVSFGYMLHPLGEDTNTTTGSARDDGAASATGWTAHLHGVGPVDGGSWVITIEDSSTGSSGWATIATFDALTAAGSQRLQSAAADTAVKQYVRVVATRTGGSAGQGFTYALAFARTR